MVLLKSRFGIEDLMVAMMQIPIADLTLEQLHDRVARLDVHEGLFQQHLAFSPHSYRRKLICHTPQFDLFLLCWLPGQASPIHDHVDSLNVTRVYQGVLTSRLFVAPEAHTDRYSLQLQQETQLAIGEFAGVDRYQIHQLANTSDENLVTLHIYARPLCGVQVYAPHTGHSERVPMDYAAA